MEEMQEETTQVNVELPRSLAIRTKKAAIDRRTTIKALVAQGLVELLSRRDSPSDPSHREFYD
jgi:hypothetical protein